MARYRALLIGNSTYPADEHNLQTLHGPVKDIAALNRALIDPGTGLFDDTDVTLLPEATSTRAVRALGRFFATANRDDVLLVYFSGHGKLDQSGRLHLCMQDTDSTDLLSTAVSSSRINEFAEASRARNVVIVLDCCHAGAFRGADLGQTVAGPGRYVLTSCRGTQLANDASVENGTSCFTQHLVDGLVYAASDQDGDGYVTFSDLYAYVDRRLREDSKQIPQRRVDGDGDLPLARRPVPAIAGGEAAVEPSAGKSAATSPGQAQARPADLLPSRDAGTEKYPTAEDRPARSSWARTGGARRAAVLAGAAVVAVGGVIAAVLLLTGGSSGTPGSQSNGETSSGTYVATGPWRLTFDDQISGYDRGCTITLTDANSGSPIRLPLGTLYGNNNQWQIYQTGSFQWHASNTGCIVVPEAGSGADKLPLAWPAGTGDSDAFMATPQLAVQVTDYNSSQQCSIVLRDPTNGQPIAFQTATQGKNSDTVVLNAGGRPTAYLSNLGCGVRVSAAP
jgi:hypothetical protein